MDIEDWEILPHGGYLDYQEEKTNPSTNTKSKFNMHYFDLPSSPPRMILLHPNRVVVNPVPFQLEPEQQEQLGGEDDQNQNRKADVPDPMMIVMPEIKGPDLAVVSKEDDDQDPISQVFFKKMKENEFVDMKMDSPKSPTKFDFSQDNKGEILDTKICSPRRGNLKVEGDVEEEEVNWGENGGGLNLWKWSLSGIGAICSFGVAAATVCVIIFGSQQRIKHHHDQKLRFQIYADDKRIKQVVHHATKLNEAITAVRGVPISRAHITYGGYYEAL